MDEIETIVHKFENCEYSPQEFTHTHHLTVAAWYLQTAPPDQALARMRRSLQRFTTHHHVRGYHETITRFWIEIVSTAIAPESGVSAVESINRLLVRHSRKDEIFDYYSRERVLSDAAREVWFQPDLQPLPRLAAPAMLRANVSRK